MGSVQQYRSQNQLQHPGKQLRRVTSRPWEFYLKMPKLLKALRQGLQVTALLCFFHSIHKSLCWVWLGRVNFLPSGWHGAVFWICAECRANNRDVFIIAEQRSHRTKAFSAFHTSRLVRRLGVQETGRRWPEVIKSTLSTMWHHTRYGK